MMFGPSSVVNCRCLCRAILYKASETSEHVKWNGKGEDDKSTYETYP